VDARGLVCRHGMSATGAGSWRGRVASIARTDPALAAGSVPAMETAAGVRQPRAAPGPCTRRADQAGHRSRGT